MRCTNNAGDAREGSTEIAGKIYAAQNISMRESCKATSERFQTKCHANVIGGIRFTSNERYEAEYR